MASVRGSVIVTVVPLPFSLATSIEPLRASIALFDDVHAHTAARDAGHLLCGREPRRKDETEYFPVRGFRAGRQEPVFCGLRR